MKELFVFAVGFAILAIGGGVGNSPVTGEEPAGKITTFAGE